MESFGTAENKLEEHNHRHFNTKHFDNSLPYNQQHVRFPKIQGYNKYESTLPYKRLKPLTIHYIPPTTSMQNRTCKHKTGPPTTGKQKIHRCRWAACPPAIQEIKVHSTMPHTAMEKTFRKYHECPSIMGGGTNAKGKYDKSVEIIIITYSSNNIQ